MSRRNFAAIICQQIRWWQGILRVSGVIAGFVRGDKMVCGVAVPVNGPFCLLFVAHSPIFRMPSAMVIGVLISCKSTDAGMSGCQPPVASE